MTVIEAAILGLVQGLTEFLPVSSSGHLVLAQEILGIEATQDVSFEVMVHLGTALAVLTALRGRVLDLVQAPFQAISQRRITPNTLTVMWIIIATIPVALVGLSFEDQITSAFGNYMLVSCALLFTAVCLFATRFVAPDDQPITAKRAILIGCAQAIAIIPGISRSGSTICMALFLGVKRETAAEFSFLLAIPAILGASVLKAGDLFSGTGNLSISAIVVGTTVAYLSGYFAIRLLLAVVRRGRLDLFGYYCAAVGIGGLIVWSVQS